MQETSQRILNSLSNDKQKEIYCWLVHHYHGHLTPVGTWQLLFNERNGDMPDVCIALYDGLSYEEKIELEFAFSEYAMSITKK